METAALTPSLAQLRARLPGVMLRDQRRLSRRAGQAAGMRDGGARDQALSQILAELQRGYTQHDRVLRPSLVKVARNS